VVKEALRRAYSIMHSKPQGPVYLMMQRETLTQPWRMDEVRRFDAAQHGSTGGGGADPKLVSQLVERLLAAADPILITGYAGCNPRTSALIGELAELAGIAVFESNMTSNISHDLPCFVGFQPNTHLAKADVGLLVDVDVPWFPSEVQPGENTFWAHIDVDILKPASPMWTFPGNLRMQGDSARILEQVLDELKAEATPRFRQSAQARLARIATERAAMRERARMLAADQGKSDEINPHYLFAELDKLLAPDDLVFNEGVRNAGAALLQIRRPLPGTMMRAGGGGLGWSGGMALGAKLAAPKQMMVQIVGDGSFYFGSPCSVYAVAQHRKLPILSIVLDNSGWSAVKESTLRVYPSGEAKAANAFEAELMPDVEFGRIGEAFGAYAEKVSNPAAVPGALARCVDEVRAGRCAILHARVTRL
jgi:acetolactate synthase I/II/III large subunit